MEFFDDTSFNQPAQSAKSSIKKKRDGANMEAQVELVTSFFAGYSEAQEMDYYKSMIVDLYRAITCYRMYDSLEEFMAINPELNDCRQDIEELWKEFDRLSEPELAEVALELLRDM